MALDMSRLRKKLDKLSGNNARSNAFWKPQEGRNVIRIVPWKDEPNWPFIEAYFHYIGGRTQLSPITHGNPDPIQELADELRRDGSKDGWQKAKPFMAKPRTYVPIIDRDDEASGVQFYSFGKTVLQTLLNYIEDPDIGDITDIEDGFDLVINYTPREKSDTNFPKTDVHIRPKAVPLHDDQSLVKTWLNEQPDIWDILEEPSYDELTTFLEKFLGGDDEEEDDEFQSITESTTNSTDDSGAPTSSTVEEFTELFNS